MYSHLFDPIAFAEYQTAIVWYHERSEQATTRLITTIKEKINLICTDPHRYRNVYKSFREVSLSAFPYSIVYFIDEDKRQVVITSIYHHKRNPKRKYRK